MRKTAKIPITAQIHPAVSTWTTQCVNTNREGNIFRGKILIHMSNPDFKKRYLSASFCFIPPCFVCHGRFLPNLARLLHRGCVCLSDWGETLCISDVGFPSERCWEAVSVTWNDQSVNTRMQNVSAHMCCGFWDSCCIFSTASWHTFTAGLTGSPTSCRWSIYQSCSVESLWNYVETDVGNNHSKVKGFRILHLLAKRFIDWQIRNLHSPEKHWVCTINPQKVDSDLHLISFLTTDSSAFYFTGCITNIRSYFHLKFFIKCPQTLHCHWLLPRPMTKRL